MTKYIGGAGATAATVTGWKCNKCGRFYQGGPEHVAEYCCSTDRECEDCGKPVGCNWRIRCRGCQSLRDIKKWEGYELVEWDGETPLYNELSDTYFFDEDALGDHMAEHPDSPLCLVLCEPNHGGEIDLHDHLCDDLAEDGEPDPPKEVYDAIDIVNKWLRETTFSWSGGKKRVVVQLSKI